MTYSPLNDFADLRSCSGWANVLIATAYQMVSITTL